MNLPALKRGEDPARRVLWAAGSIPGPFPGSRTQCPTMPTSEKGQIWWLGSLVYCFNAYFRWIFFPSNAQP